MAVNNPYLTGGAYSSPYLNTGFNPVYYNTPQPQMPATPQNNIEWVQGEAGAKAHQIGPGGTHLLMDTEEQRFFIKSVDANGIPQPLRKFEYTEILDDAQPIEATAEVRESPDFVTKEEFKTEMDELKKLIVELGKKGTSSAKFIV